MAKKNNNLLIVAAAAAVGYYLYSKGYFGGVATVQAPGLNVIPTAVNTTNTNNLLSPTQSPTLAPVTAQDSRITEIMQWVNTLTGSKRSAALAAIPLMSQDEIAGLYDIVKNDFYGNGITDTTQMTFWNAWRAKYNYA